MVSVVIPTRNAGLEFATTLEMVHQQQVDDRLEVLVVDTASTDGTVELCRRFGVRVLGIQPHQFNHGLTRNYAIAKASGDYVALLVQDAVPADEAWLARMLEHLVRDPEVAGVMGQQEPRPGADPVTRWELKYRNTRLGDKTRVLEMPDPAEFERLGLEDRIYRCAYDNVSGILRRRVWERYPFQPLPFAEDLDWARRVLKAGHKLVYEPESRVIHSHDRPPAYHLKRHYVGTKTIPSIMECLPADFSQQSDGSLFQHVMALVQEARHALDALGAGPVELGAVDVAALLGVEDLERRDAVDPVRDHFFHLLRQVIAEAPAWPADLVADVIGQVAARAIGVIVGQYHHFCHVHRRVSPTLALVDASLSVGV
jgi:rhamnosyltransferase